MNVHVQVDTRDLDEAIGFYSLATGKGLAQSADRAVGQWAFFTAHRLPARNIAAGKIESLPTDIKPRDGRKAGVWWPAFIQKILNHGSGYKLHLRKAARGADANVRWTDPINGKMYSSRRTMGYDRWVKGNVGAKGGVKAADARRVSRKILRRRLSTAGTHRALFGKIADSFGVVRHRAIVGMGRPYLRRVWEESHARPDHLRAGFNLPFGSRYKSDWPGGKRPSPSAAARARMQMCLTAVLDAKANVVKDMTDYARVKIQQAHARTASAGLRRAA